MSADNNTETVKTDIVIIGGGGAGLAAAVQAAEKGASVVVVEKRHAVGGNSAMATGFFGADSPAQKRMNIHASPDRFFQMAMDYTHWQVDPRIIRAYVDISGDTIRWLEQKGMTLDAVTTLNPRYVLHSFHVVLGASIIKILLKNCQDLGVRLLYQTPVKKLLVDELGKVTGVLATTKDKDKQIKIEAGSVIIATGGYGANKRLLKKYCSTYTDDIIYLGLKELTGDGLVMATDAGAATETLGLLHYWGARYQGNKVMNRLIRRPESVWVNTNGVRYCDETVVFDMGLRGNVVDRQPGKLSYVLFDQQMIDNIVAEEEAVQLGSHWDDLADLSKDLAKTADKHYGFRESDNKWKFLPQTLQTDAEKGKIKISNTWEGIAEYIGVAPDILKTTIDEYNSFCDHGHDKTFIKQREYLVPLRTPPYIAIKCYSHFPDTIGGVKINHHMEVLDKQGNPIPGLYCAGVCAGGWQSDTYCFLLTGSMFGFALNSGRIAANSATKKVLEK